MDLWITLYVILDLSLHGSFRIIFYPAIVSAMRDNIWQSKDLLITTILFWPRNIYFFYNLSIQEVTCGNSVRIERQIAPLPHPTSRNEKFSFPLLPRQ